MFEKSFFLLAQSTQDVFGSPIQPPNSSLADPVGGLSRLAAVGIQIFFVVAAIAVLIYLLWGAFDWVTSAGDSEKIAAAQAKMTNAVIGIIMVVVAFTIFTVVAVDIVGFVERDADGSLRFKIPSINDQTVPQSCGAAGPCADGKQCIYDSASKTFSCI